MTFAIGEKVRTVSYEYFVGKVAKKQYGEVIDVQDDKVLVRLDNHVRLDYWYDENELEYPYQTQETQKINDFPF